MTFFLALMQGLCEGLRVKKKRCHFHISSNDLPTHLKGTHPWKIKKETITHKEDACLDLI